jgi:hypothetical protein
MKKSETKIVQDEQKPHATEIIADSIVEISKAMRKINATRLTRDAIVTLIQRNCGVSRASIEIVLLNLDSLEHDWLKKAII